MKKIAYFLSMLMLLTAIAPVAIASDKPADKEPSPEEQARLEQLDERVKEIKAMDFKAMDKEERKEIRNELREINKEAKALGGGVYISAGALIVILILLIILT
ncbi:hypothetical protein SAMN04488057_102487 [Cyclobacterium lianum]|uniref:Seryl-tRNA synthetase n=1 Tax=Cyclobacterium lianum TaxID=388280 RepID=A0A1M7KIK3_9BACT|nr:hypothetical protein [Cyclobacterium lianum]SHM65166.1 hypothetical protein SAMN04488057_102487 [Cyclobacterium lianum]